MKPIDAPLRSRGLSSDENAQVMQLAGFSRRWLICIVAVVAIVFILKMTLALVTYGTNDVMTWEQDLAKIDTHGPVVLYREGVQSFSATGKPYHEQPFIHPPFMIHALRFWNALAIISHLPMRFWMRFTCALADIGSLIVIWKIGKQSSGPKPRPAVLLLFALCPISIIVSGFHGNTDPIMMFLVLLSIYAIEAHKPPLLAGVLFGLALSIKIVPVIFVPAVLLYLPRTRDRSSFLISSFATFFISGLPYFLLDPLLILSKLFSYSSRPGLWGWSRISRLFEHDADLRWIYENFNAHGKVALIISILLFSSGMHRSKARLTLFFQCGLITSLFMFFTPGFGVQYLSWLVPWVICLTPAAVAAYYLTGGMFLLIVYTHWSGGFPWYLANSFEVPDWSVLGVYFGLVCWLITGVVLLLFTNTWLNENRTIGRFCVPAIPSPSDLLANKSKA